MARSCRSMSPSAVTYPHKARTIPIRKDLRPSSSWGTHKLIWAFDVILTRYSYPDCPRHRRLTQRCLFEERISAFLWNMSGSSLMCRRRSSCLANGLSGSMYGSCRSYSGLRNPRIFLFIPANLWMSISEKQVRRQGVPAANSDRREHAPGEVNVIVSARIDNLLEQTEADRHQEDGDDVSQTAVCSIAVLLVRMCRGTGLRTPQIAVDRAIYHWRNANCDNTYGRPCAAL